MNILICPNSFKGSYTAIQIADFIENAINKYSSDINTIKIPIADGGDGTIDVFRMHFKGTIIQETIYNPVFRKINAQYFIHNNIAIIELAKASGVTLLNDNQKNPFNTTTFGTGELIKSAIKNNCTEIWLGIGGSATIDGGIGVLQALGVKFCDPEGNVFFPKSNEMKKISSIDISGYIIPANCKIRVLCDVENPIVGVNGAVKVFGAQKGANEIMQNELEENLLHFTNIISKYSDNKNLLTMPFGGASGGVPIGLSLFSNVHFYKGIDFILDTLDFDKHILNADLVITAEGQIDNQTYNGKAPMGVALRCKNYNKAIIAIAGKVLSESNIYFDTVYPLFKFDVPLYQAIKNTENAIDKTIFEILKSKKII